MRTLIGELLLKFKDQASAGSKQAVRNVESDLSRLKRAATTTGNLNWGASFQRQLDQLRLSPREFQAVQTGWVNLNNSLRNKDLSKALRSSEIQQWKTRTLGHFSDVRLAIDKTERRARRMQRAMGDGLLRPLMVMGGGYTGAYMAGIAGREGFSAASSRLREQTRQRMASIPVTEQTTIHDRARDLSEEFGSIAITDIMEMARVARNTMGETGRGLQILDKMVAAMVTLQTMKGPEAAVGELNGLIKALDNLGKNAAGEIGIDNMNAIIETMVKASQIEGVDLDLGRMMQFARRSKIAGVQLSNEFMGILPAFTQDMSPETFGAGLSSAYQSFVIGANSVASKKNLEYQKKIGIRKGEGKGELVGDEIFATNPYQWVREVLIPALAESGTDINNDVEVAKAVAQLSRNTNATGLITRMITQREQTDRLRQLYSEALGTSIAEDLRYQDPFVGWQTLKSSLDNLAGAVGEDVMPTITNGLNSLADTVNSLARTIQDNPLAGYSALGIGGAASIYGGVKAFKGLTSLLTAGPALQLAATQLSGAAAALRGSSAVDAVTSGRNAKGVAGSAAGAGLLGRLGFMNGTAIAAGLYYEFETFKELFSDISSVFASEAEKAEQRKSIEATTRKIDEARAENGQAPRRDLLKEFLEKRQGGDASDDLENSAAKSKKRQKQNEVDEEAVMSQPVAPSMSDEEMRRQGSMTQAVADAERSGAEIKAALSPTAQPAVDTSQIQYAIQLALELNSVLSQGSSLVGNTKRDLKRALGASHTDFDGVST